MLTFALRRLLVAIPTLLVVSFAMFMILFKTGDPLARVREQTRFIDPAVIELIREQNHLDEPWFVQYWLWLKGFVTGDWGTSLLIEGQTAFGEVTRVLPATLLLMGLALAFTIAIALPIGIIGATRRYSTFDNVTTGFAYFGFATPTFFIGLMLQLAMLRVQKIGWGVMLLSLGLLLLAFSLPALTRGRGVPLAIVASLTTLAGAAFLTFKQGELFLFTAQRFSATAEPNVWSLDHLRHLVLPVITLSVISIAGWSRYLRGSMLDVLNQDYLRTARAKGVSERSVVYRHGLRNAMLPLITITAIDAALLFSGAVVTESVFSWPGIGSLLLKSVNENEVPTAMAIVMIGAIMVVFFNLVADILYAVADPRIRLS